MDILISEIDFEQIVYIQIIKEGTGFDNPLLYSLILKRTRISLSLLSFDNIQLRTLIKTLVNLKDPIVIKYNLNNLDINI